MVTSQTPPPQFSPPNVAGFVVAQQATTTPRDDVAEAEARVIAKLRALMRDGRGSMMITVMPGSVQFWRVLPDGRSEIG